MERLMAALKSGAGIVLLVGCIALYGGIQYAGCWAIGEGIGSALRSDEAPPSDTDWLVDYAERYTEAHHLPMAVDDNVEIVSVSALDMTFTIHYRLLALSLADQQTISTGLAAERAEMAEGACAGDLEGNLLRAGYNVRFAYHASDMRDLGSLLFRPQDCEDR